ncbi:MAG: phospholipase D family protein [Bacteroidota bacterium]
MDIIKNNWLKYFLTELSDTQEIYIVSPFITDNIVKLLLNAFKGRTIRVITRYNLNDFNSGVSSLTAIERLLNNKALIKGVKGLHSKLYLFDQKSVIITSANFTNGGFFNNKEFGILSKEQKIINQSYSYFNDLWDINSKLLNQVKVNEWRNTINKHKSIPKTTPNLKDHGASYQESVIVSDQKYFIKFFGKGDERSNLDDHVMTELDGGCSHFALSFSRTANDARPKRYNDGDIVFMARMTQEPNDYAIYGRAIAHKHHYIRDVASEEDIKHIHWLKDWPILVRVKEPIFLNSTYKNCPKLGDLMNELNYDSFASTKRKYDTGIRDIEPKKTLMRKGDVILSKSGAQWLELAFEKALKKEGKVDKKIINSFYRGSKIKQ